MVSCPLFERFQAFIPAIFSIHLGIYKNMSGNCKGRMLENARETPIEHLVWP